MDRPVQAASAVISTPAASADKMIGVVRFDRMKVFMANYGSPRVCDSRTTERRTPPPGRTCVHFCCRNRLRGNGEPVSEADGILIAHSASCGLRTPKN